MDDDQLQWDEAAEGLAEYIEQQQQLFEVAQESQMQNLNLSAVQAWQQIMQQLVEAPATLAEAEGLLTTLRLELASEKRLLETIGDALVDVAVVKAGGVKEFGPNEETRKKRSAQVKAADVRYVNQERQVEADEAAVLRQQNLVDDLTRQYGAICYQARLVAAMLQYLGQAGAPVNHAAVTLTLNDDVHFAGPNGFNGNEMTAADAESFGF